MTEEKRVIRGKGFFERVFPPPEFLKMRSVGLSFSDDGITALELVPRNGRMTIGRYGHKECASGVITGGTINDKESVISLVRSMRDELGLDFVNLSFSEEKAYLYQTKLSSESYGNERSALELSLEEFVPLSAPEAVFDYSVLGSDDSGSDVIVAVAPRSVVEGYISVARAAGLFPISLCIEAEAVARAVVNYDVKDPLIIFHMATTKTGIFVVANGSVQFTSTVNVGCAPRTEINTEADKSFHDPFSTCANSMSILKDEVSKILSYWRSHGINKGNEAPSMPKKIILSGRPSGVPGFDSYVSAAFSIPAEITNVWQNAFSLEDYTPPISRKESFIYAAAVGLALENNC